MYRLWRGEAHQEGQEGKEEQEQEQEEQEEQEELRVVKSWFHGCPGTKLFFKIHLVLLKVLASTCTNCQQD